MSSVRRPHLVQAPVVVSIRAMRGAMGGAIDRVPRTSGFAIAGRNAYLWAMLKRFEFCIPTTGKVVPSVPEWFHEIKYDGYRLRVERDGEPRPADHPRRK